MEKTILNVENILAEAVEIARADRQAFVEKACDGNAELRAQVERLLANHDKAGSFLEHPAAVLDTAAMPANPVAVGARIGPYKLLEIIGEGGMGVVYLAEQQEPVRRQVALKVIKPGMDSKQIVARFEAERQALALMDHLNIAKVLDAGASDTGHPYFVMELVRGIAITDYCDQARLTVRQRLDVFMQVCRAVQHAHTKGVIHRDLKPSNVLVTSDDGVPVPKIIDFGVAKALEQPLTERTLHTGYAQMVGTPLYMSPEQAELNLRGVDTRSDIYSLGVLLYELLSGTTPFDKERLRAVDFDELRRILREEEPPRLSTRMSTLGAALATVSERRGMDTRALRAALHGELDWIVLKALDKDRDRRYETASAFAADVHRYLKDEPVQACPPSAVYRLRKYALRNKVALVTSGLVAAALLIGTAVSAWQAVEAISARQLADDRLESEKLALKDAKFNLEHAEVNLDFALEALDAVYMKEIEQRVSRERQFTAADKEFLQRGLSFYEKLAKSNSGNTVLQRETAKANRRIGFLLFAVFGKREEAEVAFRKAIPLFESLLQRSPGVVDYRSELSGCQLGLAICLPDDGANQEVESLIRQAVAAREDLADEFPRDPVHRRGLAASLARLGFLLKQPKAEEPLRRALNIFERLSAEFPQESLYRREMADIHQMKARWLSDSGQAREAEPHYRKARDLWVGLAAASPKDFFLRQEQALFLLFHARFLRADGKSKEAEEVFQKSLELHQQLMTEQPTYRDILHRTTQIHHDLANLFLATKRPLEAANALRNRLDIWNKAIEIRAVGDTMGGFGLVRDYQELAQLLRKNGKLAEEKEVYQDAEKTLRKLVATLPDSLARDPSPGNRKRIIESYWALADVLCLNGKDEEAIAVSQKASRLVSDDPEVRRNLGAAVGIYQDQAIRLFESGQTKAAEPIFQRVLNQYADLLAVSPKDFSYRLEMAHVCLFYGRSLRGQGKLKEAQEVFQKAVELHQQLITERPTDDNIIHRTVQAHYHLGRLFHATKRPLEAEVAMRSGMDVWTTAIGSASNVINGSFVAGYSQELGQLLGANGKQAEEKEVYQDTEKSLRKLVATLPDSLARDPTPGNRKRIINSYLGLTNILRLNGKDEEVIAVNQEALRLIPDDPQARKNLDAAIELKAKWEGALAAYREALRNPTNVALWPALDGTLKNKVTLDELAAAYQEALRLHPRMATTKADSVGTKQKEFSALVNLGRDLARFPEKKTESFTAFKAALNLKPDLAAEKLNEVLTQAFQGKAGRSISEYENALLSLPTQIREAHILFGDALMKYKQFEEVVAQYKGALGVETKDRGKSGNPNAYWIHREMGYAYYALGKLDEAIAASREAVRLKPMESGAHIRLAMALYKKRQYQESFAAFREALRLEPNLASALNNLSWSLATCPDIKLREPAQAVELAKKAVKLKPNEGGYWNTLGTARYRTGDWKAAIADLERSMKLSKGGDAADWFFLAMSHWQLGDKKQAARYYQEAVAWMDKNAPQDAEMLRFRAEAAELLGIKEKTN